MSAALGLCRALRSCAIFDDGRYRNWATSYMHTVPTWDHRRPEEFREAAVKELIGGKYKTVWEVVTSPVVNVEKKRVTIRIKNRNKKKKKNAKDNKGDEKDTKDETDSIEKEIEVFMTTDQNGNEWHGKSLIFASGVEDIIPTSVSLPGFAEGWGQSIFHCLFCHGFEERGAESAGVLVLVPEGFQFSVAFAGMASKLAKNVTVYTNGWVIEDEAGLGHEEGHNNTNNGNNGDREEENEEGGTSKRNETQSTLKTADMLAINRLILENGFEIDPRRITRLVPHKTNVDRSNEDEIPSIDIHFEDGSIKTHTFLVCRPNQQVRNQEIMTQLGVRFSKQTGLVEAVSAMNSTHVPGVFVAGDNNTMYQQVVNAFCQGGMTAGGVHHYLLTKELNGEL